MKLVISGWLVVFTPLVHAMVCLSCGDVVSSEDAVKTVDENIRREIEDPENLNVDEDPWLPAPVIYVDESLAMVYARSEHSKKEFPDYKVSLKMAIAMARQVQVSVIHSQWQS